MRFATTLRLFVAVCLLGGSIWFIEHRIESTDEQRSTRIIDNVPAEDVVYLMIEHGEFRVDCEKRSGTWCITRPFAVGADQAAIDRILTMLESLAREEIISAAQLLIRGLTPQDYGMMTPRARIVIGDGLIRRELLVGHDAPLAEGSLYVQLSGTEDIMATTRSVLDIIPDKVEALRDSTVLHGIAARTSRMEIQRAGGGFIQLTQTAGEWVIQQPISARADSGKIVRMLDALYAAKVAKFVWDPIVADETQETAVDIETGVAAKTELYGLTPDEAPVRVMVWVHGDEVGKGLILGKQVNETADEVYAKRTDMDSIYAVNKGIRDILAVTVNDLRDRNLFAIDADEVRYVCFQEGNSKLVLHRKKDTGWTIVEPVQWKADDDTVSGMVTRITRLTVESFGQETATNLAELRLAPPHFTVSVAAECPVPPANGAEPKTATSTADDRTDTVAHGPDRLLVGELQEGSSTVNVKFEPGDSVLAVSAAAISSIGPDPADPLVYRDRTVLAVASESVTRLSLRREGTEQTVVRDESGTWTVTVPPTNEINSAAVQDILFIVANMRARRIESHNPKDLAIFGLDRASAVLTLGLTGTEGIQKSIMVGSPAIPSGAYAMVQGQDVVFVLDEELVKLLTGNVVKLTP